MAGEPKGADQLVDQFTNSERNGSSPAGQLDPVAVRIEDHRYPRHASKCYLRKTLAHALVSQFTMDNVDIGDLQGDVAPAGCLTSRIDGCGWLVG
jgi:hypothetical protein